MDDRTKEVRSRTMSRIRSRGNRSTELRLIALMKAYGIKGWRRHLPLPGTPDFVFRKERLAVFVDGCFWHGCPNCYTAPQDNKGFWQEKIRSNRQRDRRVVRELRQRGWRVLRIWEHALRPENEARTMRRFQRALGQTADFGD